MAFIVRHTSGIVCAPMPKEEAKRLNLNAMVAENDSAHTTAFTVSVDFKHGTSTGISADDRTLTVRNLANPNVGASDFVRPGHIFPLVSREGGVLMRSGHTEAAVDLCKLAGLPLIGVILGNGSDRGLIGITFKLTGKFDQPNLQINPLSIIAPGVFRQIFEFQ
jgi:3,4-dihydroxy 2-butanone 4-phosphate synthase/GTP cyclohydrolase II